MSDIDGIIERRGKFLVMETKNPDESISVGQKILLKALASQPNFTVILVTGNVETGDIQHYQVVNEGGPGEAKDGKKFGKKVAKWFEKVSGGEE